MMEPGILIALLALAGAGIGLTRCNSMLVNSRRNMLVIAVLAIIAAGLVLFLVVDTSTIVPVSGVTNPDGG